MAEAGYGCVFGDCKAQFQHMITDISNGATVTLCDEHYGPGLIPLLAAALGVDFPGLYTVIERFVKRESAKAEKELADAQAAAAVKGSQDPARSPDGGQDDDDEIERIEREETGLFASTGEEAP